MGAAPMSFVLWDRFLKYTPQNPKWINRDRFILSAGHGSMLQYALLHLTGFASVTMEDIKSFRQLDEDERQTRGALARLEAGALRRFYELERSRHA